MHIFEEVLFFKLRATYKQKKQIIDLIYLVSVRCGRLAEAKGHETDWRDKEKAWRKLYDAINRWRQKKKKRRKKKKRVEVAKMVVCFTRRTVVKPAYVRNADAEN